MKERKYRIIIPSWLFDILATVNAFLIVLFRRNKK